MKITGQNRSNDDVNSTCPVYLEYTDGSPDHNTILWTLKIGHVVKLIMLDLYLLVAVRTAPSLSYASMAEMSMKIYEYILRLEKPELLSKVVGAFFSNWLSNFNV